MTVPALSLLYNPKCRLCPLWKETQTVCVPSSGRVSQYKALIVGEAPGRNEEEQGTPFVGRAGSILNRALREAFLSDRARDEIVVTNAVKCRPRGNRTPSDADIDTCVSAYLTHEIERLDAYVILALGNVAASALLNETGMTRMRGTWHRLDSDAERWVMPTYHPAYIVYNGLDSVYWKQFLQDVSDFAARAIAH